MSGDEAEPPLHNGSCSGGPSGGDGSGHSGDHGVGGDVGCLWLGLDFLSFAAASVMRLVLAWLLEMVERLGVGLALP